MHMGLTAFLTIQSVT